jgi:hypothetical protein
VLDVMEAAGGGQRAVGSLGARAGAIDVGVRPGTLMVKAPTLAALSAPPSGIPFTSPAVIWVVASDVMAVDMGCVGFDDGVWLGFRLMVPVVGSRR